MLAIRVHEFGGPEALTLEEAPDPAPGPGEILVRVHAAGVNPVETYVRAGKYPRLPSLPYTPGTDAGGVVEAVGAGVEDIRVDDWVYTYGSLTGTYAELTLCSREHVFPLPARISFAEGAAIGVPCGAAWRALFPRGQAKAGETLLVHGATGSVGSAAIQLARAAGLIVVGTAGSGEGRNKLLGYGAHHAVDHDVTKDAARVKELTGGKGFDIILEMLANVNLAADLPALASYGRVVVVGSRGPIEIDPRGTMGIEADIRGMSLPHASPAEIQGMHMALRAALENGSLRPPVAYELPLKDARLAHVQVMQGGMSGKIVLVPREAS